MTLCVAQSVSFCYLLRLATRPPLLLFSAELACPVILDTAHESVCVCVRKCVCTCVCPFEFTINFALFIFSFTIYFLCIYSFLPFVSFAIYSSFRIYCEFIHCLPLFSLCYLLFLSLFIGHLLFLFAFIFALPFILSFRHLLCSSSYHYE